MYRVRGGGGRRQGETKISFSSRDSSNSKRKRGNSQAERTEQLKDAKWELQRLGNLPGGSRETHSGRWAAKK